MRFLPALLVLAASGWSQTITVTQPSAGAVWKKGETHTTHCTNQGNTGANVRIALRIANQNDPVLVGEDFR